MKTTFKRRMLRRMCVLLATVAVFLTACGFAAAADSPAALPAGSVRTTVLLDGKEILAGECLILDSVTYVPLRKFSSHMDDCKVTWDQATATATVRTDSLTVTAETNSLYITANGHYYYTVAPIRNFSGTLYVPIRPLVRAFGATLTWNAAARGSEIVSSRGVAAVAPAAYNADEVYWLSRIISAESRGEPLTGQIAVGNVVLNRVASKQYPNTIYGVIFDRKYGTQFSPVSFGTIYNAPAQSSVIAAKICLEGYTLSDKVLFFLNPRIATNNWIVRARTFAFTVGNHDFYE